MAEDSQVLDRLAAASHTSVYRRIAVAAISTVVHNWGWPLCGGVQRLGYAFQIRAIAPASPDSPRSLKAMVDVKSAHVMHASNSCRSRLPPVNVVFTQQLLVDLFFPIQ